MPHFNQPSQRTASKVLDFDGPADLLVKDAYHQGIHSMRPRLGQFSEDYKQFSAFMAAEDRNPDGANVFTPKIMSIIRTKVPRDVRANFGSRPIIPLSTKREEFSESVRVTQDIVDAQMSKANAYVHGSMALLLKTTYGTSLLDGTPFYDTVQEPLLIQTPFGIEKHFRPVQRLKYRLRAWAPWEFVVDPLATGLEERGQCRYLIKRPIVSKREIMIGWQKGLYPGLDIEKLIALGNTNSTTSFGGTLDQEGLKMMQEQGLVSPHWDDDVGMLMRYESEDRYIDMFVLGLGTTPDGIVLRETGNPFKHGLINATRFVHDLDANTQNQFFGIGEVKPNEVMQALDNDLWNMALDSHQKVSVPTIYYGSGIDKNALTRSLGGMVPVKTKDRESAASQVHVDYGQPLPVEHYALIDRTERYMDLSAGQFDVQRGAISPGQQTATELLQAESQGDSRTEHNTRLGEEISMKDFGAKTIENIVQASSIDDMVEVVGMERAGRAIMVSLIDAPGIINMEFKGSDRVKNLALRQQTYAALLPDMIATGAALPGAGYKLALEMSEFDDETIEKVIIPDAVRIQMEAVSQQIDIQEDLVATEAANSFQLQLKAADAAKAQTGASPARTPQNRANARQTQNRTPNSPQGARV